MKNYVVVSDSCGDLSPMMAEGIVIIPYIYNLDGTEYYNHPDNRDQSIKDFYDALRAGKMATTTQITPQRYEEVWEPFLQEGKDVLYICLSSMLSKSYEMSQLAARDLTEKYPDRKIITIDSTAASMGIGLLGRSAIKAQEEGKSIEDAAAYVEDIRSRLHHWVMADDLQHLRRGGRVSGAAAFVGSMLSVKPVLTVTREGKLLPLHKARGRDKAFDFISGKLEEAKYDPKYGPIFIAHSDVPDYAKQMQDMITAKFGYTSFLVNDIGPVIGAHTGPGTIALIFEGAEARLS